ncbi:MAG: hypothetical protein J6L79_04510 [Muribaculaceae bacterium]|nr:hypothetical protein [Muribaculaceae bacterium]
MQKIIFLLCMILGAFSSSAQTEISTKNNIDSISSYIATLLEDIDRRLYKNELNDRYRFYPTENIYNFLKLDIRTGRIAQVQWSLDISKEGSVSINSDDLSWGRGSLFELYPTKNMYQFLLLDKSNGRAWHVQWGLKDKERWIRSIY